MAESISGKKRVNFAIGDERQYQQQSESTQRDNYANGKRLHFDPYSPVIYSDAATIRSSDTEVSTPIHRTSTYRTDASDDVYIDCSQGVLLVQNQPIFPNRTANFAESPNQSLKRPLNPQLFYTPPQLLNQEEPARKANRSASTLSDTKTGSSLGSLSANRSPELPPTPPSPLYSKYILEERANKRSSTAKLRASTSASWLNCSSNYQTLFDLSLDQPENSENQNPAPTSDRDNVFSPEKPVESTNSFGSHTSEVSSATTTSGQQNITSSNQFTPSKNNLKNDCVINCSNCRHDSKNFCGSEKLSLEPLEPPESSKKSSLVDILISPARKRFNFSFRQNKIKHSTSENCIKCSSFGSFRFSQNPAKFLTKSPKKQPNSNSSLSFPRETKFSITTFSSPEPETFVLKMKIKEKLKPRSLSTSGRAGSKKSSEFSELHFGRKTDSDFEDDGGFSQFQELQQSFFNRRGRQGSDSGSHTAHRGGDPHEHTMEYNTAGGPVTTITRRVRSVVDKPGSAAGKHGKDHSNCDKCNKAQPDLFQTLALTHNKRSPSGDVWDGAGGPAGGGPLGGGNRPRYASESNLLRAPMKPMAPYGYSPSVQNVYLPNGATPHTMRRPFGGLGGPGGAGTVVPSNTCYVQWGTEVKKLSLPLAHPPYYDENSGLAGGDQDRSVALNNMRELHGLLVSLFPIAVTEEDLSSKKKVVYIKDENTGIFYELEDITDVKPRCFLSIRDYASAASGTLPHSKSGHGIYDKADGTPGSGTGPGMGRLGSGTGARPPLKLSVFQPVAPSGRTNSDGRGSAPLVHPKATGGGSQPAGLDQLDRERSSSFASRDQTGRGLGRGGGAQTLGRNFTAGSSIKAQNTSRTMATPPGPRISQNEDTISPETEGDVYLAKTPPGFLGIDQDDGSGDRDGTESGLGAKSSAVDRLNASRHTNESSNTRERIEKSSTILIRDQVGDSSAQNSKLDHIEGQLGDLTQLVGTLLASQKEKSKSSGGSKDNKEQEARIAAELETLEKLKYLFEQQLQNKSNSSQSSNATTSSTMMNIRHHNQYISTVNEKNRITFDQLCALRERTRHLRLELNQLKRAHANHVTASQLMIREASQKICAAIEAFAQHARKDEEARGKRTSALAQAWALHLATLDKLESEISEMELMLEKMRSDADHYSKFPPSNNQQRQELKTIWDRRVEQLTHSVQDTGILISKVKVDLLEFETQMGDLVRLGGGVGEGQRRLLKDGPERLALFIERIRLLNSRLSQLKTLEMEVLNFQLHVEDVSSLSRPQSTPPEVPLHLNIGSSESERLNIIGMGGADSRSSSLKRVGRGGRQPVKVSTSTAANRYNLDSTSTTNLDGSSLSLNNKSLSRSYGSLNNSNMYATNNTNNNVNNTSYSLFEQHSYSTNKDGKGSTVTSTRTAGSGGAQAEKDRTDLMMLMTDLDAFSPQMASLSQLTNQQSSKRKTSASQMKRKRAESTRDRRNDEFSGSILDTAYASDRDSKEVIRKNSSSMMNTSSSSKSTTRVVNRETVIDDYYSALHQLQRTNREHLSSSRGNLPASELDDSNQRCRTDLLVGSSKPLVGGSLSSLLRSGSPTAGPPLSPGSTATSSADKAKQVTTYTYYTITKDGQKKTIYGGKQQKVVTPEEQNV